MRGTILRPKSLGDVWEVRSKLHRQVLEREVLGAWGFLEEFPPLSEGYYMARGEIKMGSWREY
jgi:hypothetical protein